MRQSYRHKCAYSLVRPSEASDYKVIVNNQAHRRYFQKMTDTGELFNHRHLATHAPIGVGSVNTRDWSPGRVCNITTQSTRDEDGSIKYIQIV